MAKVNIEYLNIDSIIFQATSVENLTNHLN